LLFSQDDLHDRLQFLHRLVAGLNGGVLVSFKVVCAPLQLNFGRPQVTDGPGENRLWLPESGLRPHRRLRRRNGKGRRRSRLGVGLRLGIVKTESQNHRDPGYDKHISFHIRINNTLPEISFAGDFVKPKKSAPAGSALRFAL
jgi:hypothetical protein